MKVLLDARMAFHSGIGRYVRGLARWLPVRDPGLDLRLLVPERASTGRWADLGQTVPFTAPIYGLREQWAGSRLAVRQGDDRVWHVPHYNAPWLLPRRSVVTIHDLTHFELPGLFPRRRVWAATRVLRRAVARAGSVIAVSDATRLALLRRLPGCAGKVTVIHHGVEACFAPQAPEAVDAFRTRLGLGRYLIFVGPARPHKNLDALLRAREALGPEAPDLLVVAPGTGPAPVAAKGIRVVTDLPDQDLALAYCGAEALVVPSLGEGFGLPALEAMACGTAVAAAEIPALAEVAGDAAVRFDPRDPGDLASTLRRLLADDALRRELGSRGIRRARGFTWEAAADRTLEIYREVARMPVEGGVR